MVIIYDRAKYHDHIEWLHDEMVQRLSEYMDPSSEVEWTLFKASIKPYLSTLEMQRINSLCDVCFIFRSKGFINYGNYKFLRQFFHREECESIIDEFSRKITEIKKKYSSKGDDVAFTEKQNRPKSIEIPSEEQKMEDEEISKTLEGTDQGNTIAQSETDDAISRIPSEEQKMEDEEISKTLEGTDQGNTIAQSETDDAISRLKTNIDVLMQERKKDAERFNILEGIAQQNKIVQINLVEKITELERRLKEQKIKNGVEQMRRSKENLDTVDTRQTEKKKPSVREAMQMWNTANIRDMLRNGFDPLEKGANGISGLEVALHAGQADNLKLIVDTVCNAFTQYIRSIGIDIKSAFLGYIPKEHQTKITISNVRVVVLLNEEPRVEPPKVFGELQVNCQWKDSVNVEKYPEVNLRNHDQHMKVNITALKAKELFKDHRNLEMVHPSLKFVWSNNGEKIESCIALYCYGKGIIPLGESKFPKEIGDIKTDVREGFCQLANDEIRPGTRIKCRAIESRGTIGGFVEIKGREFFVTAAHTCVEDHLRLYNFETQKVFRTENRIAIYRDSYPRDNLGTVCRWYFESDNPDTTNVDAALVELKWNISLDGLTVPENNKILLDTNQDELIGSTTSQGTDVDDLPVRCASTVLTCDKTSLLQQCVVKYGGMTGFTVGMFNIDTFSKINYEEIRIMYNQIQITALGHGPFCDRGDSGAFCFIVEKKEDEIVLHPFAMIIGVTNEGNAIATPLNDVFDRLELNTKQGISVHPVTRIGMQQESLTKQLKTFTQDINRINLELQDLKTTIKQEIGMHKEFHMQQNQTNTKIMDTLTALLNRTQPHSKSSDVIVPTNSENQKSSEQSNTDVIKSNEEIIYSRHRENSEAKQLSAENEQTNGEWRRDFSEKENHATEQLNAENEQPNGKGRQDISDREGHIVAQITALNEKPNGEIGEDFSDRKSCAIEQVNAENEQPDGEGRKDFGVRESCATKQVNAENEKPNGEGRVDFSDRESHAADQINTGNKKTNGERK